MLEAGDEEGPAVGEVGENMSSVLALGVDGLTCNLAANGHEPENVELLGETLTKVMQG